MTQGGLFPAPVTCFKDQVRPTGLQPAVVVPLNVITEGQGSDCRGDGTCEALVEFQSHPFLSAAAASRHILTLAALTTASITHQNPSKQRSRVNQIKE